jgi:hypothetical protein
MDELVKRLRLAKSVLSRNKDLIALLSEAADAIEVLQKAVNFHKFNSEFWEDKYNTLADEKWIPVTERLPELNAPCLVYNKAQPMMVGWRIDDKRFSIPGSFLPDHPTHWMPLPEPPKE